MGLFAASGMLAPVAGGYELEQVGSRSKLTALTSVVWSEATERTRWRFWLTLRGPTVKWCRSSSSTFSVWSRRTSQGRLLASSKVYF